MIDPRLADAQYRSFPAFTEWLHSEVDNGRWDRYTAVLQERGKASPEQLAQAREVVKRAAAIDTGAIEGLYEVDRGFTFTVATQAAIWEAALDARGQKVRALFESQLKAYDLVLDVATQDTPVSEAWIRRLHQELCEPQQTYQVVTEVGLQTQSLPLGEYKHLPNHVRLPDGQVHAYAPVDLVGDEMYRLCEILRGEAFLAAHPVLQASYVHYAFVVIHPFADGNGRVARALASVYTYRSQSIPLMILAEDRKAYLDSLASANAGNHQAFVDFVMERALDSILLVNESLGTALVPQVDVIMGELKSLYTTKGGYRQEEVDGAGQILFDLLANELTAYAERLQDGARLNAYVNKGKRSYEFSNPDARVPVLREWNVMTVNAQLGPPYSEYSSREFGIRVPVDAVREDDVSLVELDSARRVFSARMSELAPAPSVALKMRVSIAVERIWSETISETLEKAKKKLR